MSVDKGKREAYFERLTRMFEKSNSARPRSITLAEFLEGNRELTFRIVAGEQGLSNCLTSTKIQKPGLALAGYLDYLEPGRFQVLGRAEIDYFSRSAPLELRPKLEDIFKRGVACFLITRDQSPPAVLVELANTYNVPILVSPLEGGDLVEGIVGALEMRLAPQVSFHGDFISVYGQGVLIMGDSGEGKSECALDLIIRGHQLVADDVVYVWRNSAGRLWGRGNELLRDHMEIRGLGIINVKDLFSIRAVMEEHQIDFGIYLERWDPHRNYQFLGLNIEHFSILGVKVPLIRLPVAPGRNIANLIEVAVRNQLLRRKGQNSEQDIADKLDQLLALRREAQDSP